MIVTWGAPSDGDSGAPKDAIPSPLASYHLLAPAQVAEGFLLLLIALLQLRPSRSPPSLVLRARIVHGRQIRVSSRDVGSTFGEVQFNAAVFTTLHPHPAGSGG